MKIYLAGPMRGYPDDNREAFAKARERLRGRGHVVFCPHAIERATYVDGNGSLLHSIKSDLLCIEHAEAIALLPGWEGSCGATLELAYAQFLGMPVYDAMTMKEMNPVRCPWYELKGSRNWPSDNKENS